MIGDLIHHLYRYM